MDVIITYKKGGRVRRLTNIEFTEFNIPYNEFYCWEFDGGEDARVTKLNLVREIKINHQPYNNAIPTDQLPSSEIEVVAIGEDTYNQILKAVPLAAE